MSWWEGRSGEIPQAGPADQAARAIAQRRRKSCTRRELFGLAGYVAATGAAFWALTRMVAGLAVVRGESMEPTLRDGDVLMLWRLGDRAAGKIVLFRNDDGEELVKRVVALPGQTVEVREGGGVVVDGRLADEPYAHGETLPKTGVRYPLTLGENEYFVLGDHRENSRDSRNYGPIAGSQMEGNVAAVLRVGC